MATVQQNVYTNTSFSAEQTNSEEEFAEYDEITYEQTKEQTNDGNTTISNIPLPRQADMQSRSKIQVTLWLLFAIIAFFLAIVITGVVTFFITKERFTGKQCKYKLFSVQSRKYLVSINLKMTCDTDSVCDICVLKLFFNKFIESLNNNVIIILIFLLFSTCNQFMPNNINLTFYLN